MAPLQNYSCSRCDLKGSSACTWGHFLYQIGRYRYTVPREVGICHNCEAITAVELLPDKEELEHQLQLAKAQSGPTHYLREQIQLAELLEKRESKARCLECGSHDFYVISDILPDRERFKTDSPWRTGIIHKHCGGRIYVQQPLLHVDDDPMKKRIYTKEGIEITYQEQF